MADLALAWDGHWGVAWAGVVLWGLHLAMTQGLLSAMVAGTAYGFFKLASGLAGLLWDSLGVAFTFVAGAVFSGAAIVLLLFRRSRP